MFIFLRWGNVKHKNHTVWVFLLSGCFFLSSHADFNAIYLFRARVYIFLASVVDFSTKANQRRARCCGKHGERLKPEKSARLKNKFAKDFWARTLAQLKKFPLTARGKPFAHGTAFFFIRFEQKNIESPTCIQTKLIRFTRTHNANFAQWINKNRWGKVARKLFLVFLSLPRVPSCYSFSFRVYSNFKHLYFYEFAEN